MAQIDRPGRTGDGLRIGLGGAIALAPDAFRSDEHGGGQVSDEGAEWAAALSHDRATALTALVTGERPDGPFDRPIPEAGA